MGERMKRKRFAGIGGGLVITLLILITIMYEKPISIKVKNKTSQRITHIELIFRSDGKETVEKIGDLSKYKEISMSYYYPKGFKEGQVLIRYQDTKKINIYNTR